MDTAQAICGINTKLGVSSAPPDPTAFVTLNYEEVYSLCLGAPRVPQGGHLVQDRYIVVLEDSGVQGWATSVCDRYSHSFLNGHVDQFTDPWIGEEKANAKWVVGRAPCLSYLFSQVRYYVAICGHACRRVKAAQTAGVRYCAHELWIGDPRHPRLQYGVFYA